MDTKYNIGEVVRKERIACRLTQKELGKKIGIGGAAVYQIETGRSGVSVDTLLAMCEVFKRSPNFLLGWMKTDWAEWKVSKYDKE